MSSNMESFNWFRWVVPSLIEIPPEECSDAAHSIIAYIEQRHSLNKNYKFSALEFACDADLNGLRDQEVLFNLDEKLFEFYWEFYPVMDMSTARKEYISMYWDQYTDKLTRFDVFDEPLQRALKKKRKSQKRKAAN